MNGHDYIFLDLSTFYVREFGIKYIYLKCYRT